MTKYKRTVWNSLPYVLAEAGQKAFPNCKSPRSVPDDKWNKLLVAYETWHHVFFSDGLSYLIPMHHRTAEQKQEYFMQIAEKIANDEI